MQLAYAYPRTSVNFFMRKAYSLLTTAYAQRIFILNRHRPPASALRFWPALRDAEMSAYRLFNNAGDFIHDYTSLKRAAAAAETRSWQLSGSRHYVLDGEDKVVSETQPAASKVSA